MKKFLFTPSLMAILITSLLFSCAKKDDEVTDQDISAAADYSFSQNEYDDILKVSQAAMESSNLRTSGGCPSVSLVGTDSLILDFGSSCTEGSRTRSGKIKIQYSGKFSSPGSVIKIVPDNYYVNGKHIEGEKTVTNVTSDSIPTWTIKVVNGKITFEDQKVSYWNSERTRAWVKGYTSKSIMTDDEYKVTGTATGQNRNGENYSALITNPLVFYTSCLMLNNTTYPVMGTIDITPGGKLTRTLDFGSRDECDKISNVSIGGKKMVFLLP